MSIQKHLNWPIYGGKSEFFRSCPRKVLHTSILTVKIRFVSLFRCPTRHLRTSSGPLGVPRLPPARSASVREMAQALSAASGRRSKRRKVHIPVGRYPDRAAGPASGSRGPQSRYHSSLGWDCLLPAIVSKRNSRLVSPKPRRWSAAGPAETFRQALSRPGYSVWIESSALQSRDSPVLGLGEVVSWQESQTLDYQCGGQTRSVPTTPMRSVLCIGVSTRKSQFVFIAVWPLRIGSSGAISVLKALGGWANTTQKRRESSRRWFVGPDTSNCRLLSRFPGHWLEPRKPRPPATIASSMARPGGSRRARAIGCNGRRNVEIIIIQLPGFK